MSQNTISMPCAPIVSKHSYYAWSQRRAKWSKCKSLVLLMQAVDTVIAVPKDMCEIILYFYNFNDDVYCRSLLYILSVANKVQRCTLCLLD
jgi:hypothetical protein